MSNINISALADHVALCYHEARNVRHLVKAGQVDPALWRYLISLPTNRDEAWAALQPVREEARWRRAPAEVLQVFEDRFRVSLLQLQQMYGHRAWRGSVYGGNAWNSVTALVSALAEADDAEWSELLKELSTARHNTGSVKDKLEKLDRRLHDAGA